MSQQKKRTTETKNAPKTKAEDPRLAALRAELAERALRLDERDLSYLIDHAYPGLMSASDLIEEIRSETSEAMKATIWLWNEGRNHARSFPENHEVNARLSGNAFNSLFALASSLDCAEAGMAELRKATKAR